MTECRWVRDKKGEDGKTHVSSTRTLDESEGQEKRIRPGNNLSSKVHGDDDRAGFHTMIVFFYGNMIQEFYQEKKKLCKRAKEDETMLLKASAYYIGCPEESQKGARE
ncbi:hypothetical protein PV326_001361 [Microctonus aethiopoides]|nr:hypothetical protein PV326_001361 [Microctonus aethiopoides]